MKQPAFLIRVVPVAILLLLGCSFFGAPRIALDTPALTATRELSGQSVSPSNLLDIETAIPTSDTTEQDSSTATVMGMAMGYGINTYRTFVGSLRNSGFSGHIILAVSPDIEPEAESYLLSKQVSVQKIEIVDCQNNITANGQESGNHAKEATTCIAPYDTLKVRWGRFPKLRDYLQACETCTGPVLVTDVRDTFFQRDPFGPQSPPVDGLQVFEEHRSMTTQHWLVKFHVRTCKDQLQFHKPMLCSGTTIGTRAATLQYLKAMHDEMLEWMAHSQCRFNGNGDDQAIHNYLFYSGKLPFAKAIPNRVGIVHTAGKQGALVLKANKQYLKGDSSQNDPAWKDHAPMRCQQNWLDPVFDLTDDEGFFLDHDGQRSAVVHQYDRFGPLLYEYWLNRFSNLTDNPKKEIGGCSMYY